MRIMTQCSPLSDPALAATGYNAFSQFHLLEYLVRQMLFCAVLLLFCQAVLAETPAAAKLDSLNFLVGKWVGEGNAETGQAGAGSCSFTSDLQGTVLMRRNHSEYPAAGNRPAIKHDDVMVIYPDKTRQQLRAFYTDNEGHVIHYSITAAADGKSAVFLGDTEPAAPRYRLSYAITQPGHMTITFEIAQPGTPDQFQKFINGKLRKEDAN